MKVVVTGAGGFVGSALVERLAKDGHDVTATLREKKEHDSRIAYFEGADLLNATGWDEALAGAEAVVHTAARVHQLYERSEDALSDYRLINVKGTVDLATRAAEAGVKRFIYLSSIKVNGDYTEEGQLFRATDTPAPNDPYGLSKLEAEEALFKLGERKGLQIVVVRPPLVYGPGVKANFATLMRLVASGIPLPFGAVQAKRSLVARENLIDLLALCLHHPAADGQVLLVSDGEDLTVAEMLRSLGKALGKPARLIPVPPGLLSGVARVLGRNELAVRLFSSLRVDSGPTRELLSWTPPVSLEKALLNTADHFLKEQR